MRNRKNWYVVSLCACALGAFGAKSVCAQVLFSDGFESYNQGQLATTDSSTANPDSGNLWWAPGGGNELVTGTINGVTAHSGQQMIVGAGASDFDQDTVNIAYNFGGQAPIMGNISVDFWFYDANGAGDAHSVGYGELGYYDGVPSNAQYNATHSLSFPGGQIQRVILGTTNNTGADLSVYQARLLGDSTPTVGTGYGSNYINTTATRSVGWHEGTIDVGPQLAGGGNLVDFYIDGSLAGESTTSFGYGYNTLIMDANMGGSTLNYFDDVSLSRVPEPTGLLLLASIPLLLRRRAKA